ncbi:VanZ family protein [Rhodococcus kronopolitis]|uniref:VanZ family protein n=1 Tax=Rhodococcus kronopolitis TaxID=1460226 RepID=A0ABV9FQX5_9NOCA
MPTAAPSGLTRRLRERRSWPLLVAVAVSLVMLFSPGSTVPGGPPNSDKVTHFLMFAVLVYAARHAGHRVVAVALWAAAYAAASEVLQGLLPIHRSGSVWDAAADLLGVAVGLLLFRAWQVRTRRA